MESDDDTNERAADNSTVYEKAKAIVADYICETKEPYDSNPLKYWENHQNRWPDLAKVCIYCIHGHLLIWHANM